MNKSSFLNTFPEVFLFLSNYISSEIFFMIVVPILVLCATYLCACVSMPHTEKSIKPHVYKNLEYPQP